MRTRLLPLLIGLVVTAAACTAASNEDPPTSTAADETTTSTVAASEPPPADGTLISPVETAEARNHVGFSFPDAPAYPDGPPDRALVNSIDRLLGALEFRLDFDVLSDIADAGDPRAAWLIADLMRFIAPGDALDVLAFEFEELVGADLSDDPIGARSQWQSATDHLIAWDIPALEGYQQDKARIFTLIEPRWWPLFEDEGTTIDWRHISWGGVLIDDRPLGTETPCPQGCIPALDDPAVTAADGGDWYPDDGLVFGVVVNGEARAYPKNIMEVHEMVNDTLGGRRIGMPYCTLCGSAQAYLTDSVPEGVDVPVLRTSGLLSRSNKVMFDLNTMSVFDTFTGEAVSGPLLDEGIVLDQVSVVTSTWGAWKDEYPDTTIVARDGGIGRAYEFDPLQGRDDNGPIFPIGNVDERLPAQAKVLGLILDSGEAVAVPVVEAIDHLEAGGTIVIGDLSIEQSASGLVAVAPDGSDPGAHEAFWFAWSQFHPETQLWQSDG